MALCKKELAKILFSSHTACAKKEKKKKLSDKGEQKKGGECINCREGVIGNLSEKER